MRNAARATGSQSPSAHHDVGAHDETQPTAARLKVIVVDDHDAVRQSLVSLLRSAPNEFECVGDASNAHDGLALVRATQPERVLIDADLAGRDGIALIPALRTAAPCEVVVLSGHADESLLRYAMNAGATACLNKTAPAASVLAALAADGSSAHGCLTHSRK